jgi:hypothetical protein
MSTDPVVAETDLSLRILSEHILAAARHAATGRIGLKVVPGGIATPPFGPDDRWAGVINGVLAVGDAGGRRETAVSTLRAAGDFVGVRPGAPADVYIPSTPCDLDAPLTIDAVSFGLISSWYELVNDSLRRFSAQASADGPLESTPVEPTLWPEHFDVAIRLDEINYGGLAGDSYLPAPYAYVGPPADRLPASPSGFWSAPFGATVTRDVAGTVEDLVEFFRRGQAQAAAL